LIKLRILPSVFADLDPREKAFVIACIDRKIEADAKQAKEIESKSKRKR
jgi:hypothetical protein